MKTELYNAFEAVKNCYDLCMDCVFNAVSPEQPERRGCACLFACAEVTRLSLSGDKTYACGDYVPGDPLSIDIDPERLSRIYYQLFPERRVRKGESYAVPENEKPRHIYRVTFTVKKRGEHHLRIDVGAISAKAAIETAKTLWSEAHTEHMFHPAAKRRDSVESVGFIEEA